MRDNSDVSSKSLHIAFDYPQCGTTTSGGGGGGGGDDGDGGVAAA